MDWNLLKEEYKNGSSLVDLKKKYGISVGKLSYQLKKIGTVIRSTKEGNEKRRIVDYDEVVDLYFNQLLSICKIAQKLKASSSSISCWLRRNGYQLRSIGDANKLSGTGITKETELEIVKEYIENHKIHCGHLAKKYKVSKPTIAKILKERGIVVRKASGTYIDGRTPLYKAIRNSKKYAEWRTSVFERDGYKSVLSGKTGKLNAHHLFPFCLILEAMIMESGLDPVKDTDELYEMAMDYEPFWDMDNVITITEKEHKVIDSHPITIGMPQTTLVRTIEGSKRLSENGKKNTKRLSKYKGELHANYGKPRSEDTRSKISETLKKRWAKINEMPAGLVNSAS